MKTSYSTDVAALREIRAGLTAKSKRLPSWLFYDERGDGIFQQIMNLKEYYPTRCEFEILRSNRELLLQYFTAASEQFDLIEFGAGDATKTQVLLEYLLAHSVNFTYKPVDVSVNVLGQLQRRLAKDLPEVKVETLCQRYEDPLPMTGRRPRNFLFLGANIGNYTLLQAFFFLRDLAVLMKTDDLLIVGFDLKKDPRVIQRAYDDGKGVTREFNLNMLRRLNAEFGANFVMDQFEHCPVYNPATGAAESYLVSKCAQKVYVSALQETIQFKAWEVIHTEISQKYDLPMIEEMASHAGLQVVDKLFDTKKYFCDVILRKFSSLRKVPDVSEAATPFISATNHSATLSFG